jgi:hypothetical protein
VLKQLLAQRNLALIGDSKRAHGRPWIRNRNLRQNSQTIKDRLTNDQAAVPSIIPAAG